MSDWWRSPEASEGLTPGNADLPPMPPTALGHVMPPPPPPLLRRGDGPQRKRKVWLIVGTIVGVLLLIFGLFVIDQLVRLRELNTLTAKIEASESTMEDFIAKEKALLGQISPGTKSLAQLDPETYRFSSVGRQSLTQLSVDRAEIEGVSILPWHGAIARLQEKYLEHSTAWEERMADEAAASKWQDLIDAEASSVDIGPTFAVAKAAFPAAVPALFGAPLQARLTEIFRN